VASGNEGIPKGLLNRSKPFLRLGEAVQRILVAPLQPEVSSETDTPLQGFTLYTKLQADSAVDFDGFSEFSES
jgi:hypothetical protein